MNSNNGRGHQWPGRVLQKYPLYVLNSRQVQLNINRVLAYTINGQNTTNDMYSHMISGLFGTIGGQFLVMCMQYWCYRVQQRLSLQ
ncbi:hypothetical protein KEM09_18460 [Carboxylicivirga mesophila]|uniref:Uncharacterized protein n=1 Tax=Carboxylicivirga mesophila TaxID=1166478 RepID=A0ABS5KEC5_9BACT|nr:hypothetical protein [Carboxylicivirga mesophila]MBS2213404.1 hypothetical protein [Carboxylicivirga mesophila]